jgi:hypothetical protein
MTAAKKQRPVATSSPLTTDYAPLTTLAVIAWSLTILALAVGGDFRQVWVEHSGMVKAFKTLRASGDVCGVGTQEHWSGSDGYVLLRHRVHMYHRLNGNQDVERIAGRENYLIVTSHSHLRRRISSPGEPAHRPTDESRQAECEQQPGRGV